MKNKILQTIYRWCPFNLQGDIGTLNAGEKGLISCLICASNRPEELEILLDGLSRQTLEKTKYEVVVINDGAGEVIRSIVDKFRSALSIKYEENPLPTKMIGRLRNRTIALSKGEYLVLLDDDSRIAQKDFLEHALSLFHSQQPDVILPLGRATFGLVKQKYDFLDPYSFGNAGILYTREAIRKTGGFKNDLKSYEDIELSIRLILLNMNVIRTENLVYLHPPSYFYSLQKPLSIGESIFMLRHHYSFPIWLLIYINALRFLPYCLYPTLRNLQWFKISLGVFLYPFMKKTYSY